MEVRGSCGSSEINAPGGTLQMSVKITPSNATDKSVV